MDLEILEKIGLTKRESKVYLVLLRFGTSKSGEILKNSGLNTGKIYEILESLKLKGLVAESVINNVRHFSAASPNKILEFVERKEKEIEKEKDLIVDMLPRLEGLREEKIEGPRSVTYIGFSGFRTAVMECYAGMGKEEEMLGMGVTGFKNKKVNDFWVNFSRQRIKAKIKAKILFSEERGEFLRDFKKFKCTEIRVLKGITPVAVSIFGKGRVLITNYREPITCTLIYDKYTADSFRVFFEGLWEKA